MWGKFRIGRKFAYSSNFFRSATLMLAKPPPTGVVTGPFRATRVRSIDSVNSLGMYSPDFSYASAPTAKASHSNFTPVASRMRTVARVTSGPMPSPGMSVILWAIGLCKTIIGRTAAELQCDENRLSILDHGFAANLCRIFGFEQVFQLGHEFLHIFKIKVHRCKPDVSNFVIAAQAAHDQ